MGRPTLFVLPHPVKYVGNGLCAVPGTLRLQPLCKQNGTTPRHVIPSERSESRNPLKLQILPYVGTFLPRGGFLHSACATVGMTYGGTCLVFIGNSSVLSRAERHIGRSLRFRCLVHVFNRGDLRMGGAALHIVETVGAKGNPS